MITNARIFSGASSTCDEIYAAISYHARGWRDLTLFAERQSEVPSPLFFIFFHWPFSKWKQCLDSGSKVILSPGSGKGRTTVSVWVCVYTHTHAS